MHDIELIGKLWQRYSYRDSQSNKSDRKKILKEYNEVSEIKIEEWRERNEHRHYIHLMCRKCNYLNIEVDFGGTKSADAFNATAVVNNHSFIVTVVDKQI